MPFAPGSAGADDDQLLANCLSDVKNVMVEGKIIRHFKLTQSNLNDQMHLIRQLKVYNLRKNHLFRRIRS